jgi:serine phosphatase RsbU (regulator of sigma subunit)
MNISQEEFSYNRFLNMLPKFRELRPEDILIDILHNVESFSQGVEQFDDIGCLIVQRSY